MSALDLLSASETKAGRLQRACLKLLEAASASGENDEVQLARREAARTAALKRRGKGSA